MEPGTSANLTYHIQYPSTCFLMAVTKSIKANSLSSIKCLIASAFMLFIRNQQVIFVVCNKDQPIHSDYDYTGARICLLYKCWLPTIGRSFVTF